MTPALLVPRRALEEASVRELAGVGGDREWWFYNPRAMVGHLRVPVTPAEFLAIPPGLATSDAGDAGPERPRTYP